MKRPSKKHTIKKVKKFLESVDWLFSLQNMEKHFQVLQEEGRDGLAAEMNFNEKYQRITIKLYPLFFECEAHTQRKALIHELCHSLTIPLQSIAVNFLRGEAANENQLFDLGERQTSMIENIIDGFLQRKYRWAVRAYDNYVTTPKVKKRKK